MSRTSVARLVAIALAATVLTPTFGARQDIQRGTMFFKTNVGSFKLLGIPAHTADGKLQISFTGTLLVDKKTASDPKITFTGGIKKEYDNGPHLQQAFHGKGSMTIEGSFDSIQWFGRDMSAQWYGFGIARLVGEFDNNLKTGTYWYSENESDVREWGTNLREVPNPGRPNIDYTPIAKARPGGGK